jgi:HAD superfamily hydrolase (TIGR01509 family)
MIKSIWFDGGGVIVEPYRNRTTIAYIAQQYHHPQERVHQVWEKHWMNLDIGKSNMEEFLHDFFKDLQIPGSPEEIIEYYRSIILPVPGVIEILQKLQGKYFLVLANNEGKGFDDLRNEELDFFKYFDTRCSSWMLGVLKPHPLFFQHVLDEIKMHPWECVFIDDVQENLDEAQRFGIHTILFKDAEQLKKELQKLGITI